MQQPSVKAILAREGTEVSLSASPEQFSAFLVEDDKFWVNLAKSANLKLEMSWPRARSRLIGLSRHIRLQADLSRSMLFALRR